MDGPVEPFAGVVDGVPMSGLIARAADPRALVIALHGAAATPHYYDAPGYPEHSLLRIGAAQGYTVVAPWRPGYGPSFDAPETDLVPRRQVELMFGLIDRLAAENANRCRVFVVGHSLGCVLALRMAAHSRGRDLLGIEIAGTGIRRQPGVVVTSERDGAETPRPMSRDRARELFWEPAELYLDHAMRFTEVSRRDMLDAGRWPMLFPRLARGVSAPVRITLASGERMWEAPPAGLASMAALFTASSRVVTSEEYGAAHSISVGVTAREYHAEIMTFVEECAQPTR
ncbi:alpha/beta hydrolase [Nocardia sp. NBC_01377]|uniref:alpha/beta fold hydrolase n=1 Tax=Nocardia sp. NBC_01377 TaxID=2903595 RepID=UPI003253687C